MINKKIYNRLKEIAKRQETISYSQLTSELKIPYSTVNERNNFHHLIGKISEFEVKNLRPMLSVLVHHKGDIERTPGLGFFELEEDIIKGLKDLEI